MNSNFGGWFFGTLISSILLGLIIIMLLWTPIVGPWSESRRGLAELKRSEQNRQITIEEAKAKSEAAQYIAQAEITKAKGVAEANQIMAESLGGPQGYLRWKYIEMLEETSGDGKTVVYIPTEATMPILEAGKRPQ